PDAPRGRRRPRRTTAGDGRSGGSGARPADRPGRRTDRHRAGRRAGARMVAATAGIAARSDVADAPDRTRRSAGGAAAGTYPVGAVHRGVVGAGHAGCAACAGCAAGEIGPAGGIARVTSPPVRPADIGTWRSPRCRSDVSRDRTAIPVISEIATCVAPTRNL